MYNFKPKHDKNESNLIAFKLAVLLRLCWYFLFGLKEIRHRFSRLHNKLSDKANFALDLCSRPFQISYIFQS